MVPRKDKPPQILEDVSNANIWLRCPNPECGHEFLKKGAWLEKRSNHIFGCPKCDTTIVLNDEKVRDLLSNHVTRVLNMLDRMRRR